MKIFKPLDELTILYGKEEFKFSIKEMLTIDENQLIASIESTPTIYGYLSVLKSKLARQASDQEIKYRKTHGEKYLILKEDPNWDKAPTEKHIEAELNSDAELIKLRSRVVELQSSVSTLDGLLEALKQKASLIQTLSANLRSNN